MAIGLATMTYMAALTMLDWCLRQPTAPSVRGMLSSFVWQPMSGIITAHKAKQKAFNAAAAASEAPSELQPQQRTASQLLHETVGALLHLMVLMDVLSGILQCCFCYGDLPALHAVSVGNGQGIAVTALSYLIKAAAGFLLGMQLAFTYMGGRIALILFGYQDIGPVHIFDRPWMATSISDLWSNRWHQVLRYYFTGLGYSLAGALSGLLLQMLSSFGFVGAQTAGAAHQGGSSSKSSGSSNKSVNSSSSNNRLGAKGKAAGSSERKHGLHAQGDWQREVKKAARTLVVFAMSGVVHEYVVWAAFGVVTGKHFTFFMLHGLAALAEGLGANLVQSTGFGASFQAPIWLRRVWVLGFCLVTCPLFVDVLLEHRHFQNYVPPFIVPVTSLTMDSLGMCRCS
jgi:hypothetical protein